MAKPISIYELEGGPNQFFSPFCWAARFAAAHKGLPIETIRWKFREGDKIAFSNQGLVGYIPLPQKNMDWYLKMTLESTASCTQQFGVLYKQWDVRNDQPPCLQVPVIVDGNKDGKWVNDSWAIAKYLEETYPDRPSLFDGPQGEWHTPLTAIPLLQATPYRQQFLRTDMECALVLLTLLVLAQFWPGSTEHTVRLSTWPANSCFQVFWLSPPAVW